MISYHAISLLYFLEFTAFMVLSKIFNTLSETRKKICIYYFFKSCSVALRRYSILRNGTVKIFFFLSLVTMWMISYHTMSLLHIHPDDQSCWSLQSQYHDIRMPRYCHNVTDILPCCVTSKLSAWWQEFTAFMVPSKMFKSFRLKHLKKIYILIVLRYAD